MSLYSTFNSDEALETQGVEVDYGEFKLNLARAGGANHKFSKVANNKIKPYRRMMEHGTLPQDLDNKLTAEIYAETVILGWWTKRPAHEDADADGWVNAIEDKDGGLIPATRENVCKTLEALPDLLRAVMEQAQDVSLYRNEDREDDLGN